MGYRGGKKVETEGKTINQEAWSLQDWKPNSLGPNHCLPLLAPGPHRLHFPHVLESLSSQRRGGEGAAMVRSLSGPGRRLFSQLLVTSVQCGGSSCPRPLECARGAEKPGHGRGLVATHPGPLTSSCHGGRTIKNLEILNGQSIRSALRGKVLGISSVTAEHRERPRGREGGKGPSRRDREEAVPLALDLSALPGGVF